MLHRPLRATAACEGGTGRYCASLLLSPNMHKCGPNRASLIDRYRDRQTDKTPLTYISPYINTNIYPYMHTLYILMHIHAYICVCVYVNELIHYMLMSVHIFLKLKAWHFSVPTDKAQEPQRRQEPAPGEHPRTRAAHVRAGRSSTQGQGSHSVTGVAGATWSMLAPAVRQPPGRSPARHTALIHRPRLESSGDQIPVQRGAAAAHGMHSLEMRLSV